MTSDELGNDVVMLILGHRGASAVARENSLAAFRNADEMGADGVETDVRITLDGRLLLAHDPLPVDGASNDLSEFVLFEDGLDACGDEMLVNVEIKNSVFNGGFDPLLSVVEPTLQALRRRGGEAEHRWLISSFSWATVQACREMAPEIPTAWLCRSIDSADVERVAEAGHSAIHPAAPAVTPEIVEMCHVAGLALNTWKCTDPVRLVELAEMGVDGVCTAALDEALVALGRPAGRGAVSPSWSIGSHRKVRSGRPG